MHNRWQPNSGFSKKVFLLLIRAQEYADVSVADESSALLLNSETKRPTVFLLMGDSQPLKHGLNSESRSEINLCAIRYPTPTSLCMYIKHRRMKK